ncbi:MAG: RAD55 family ATPase [Candidatus Hodarchaeota archaeon]
MLPEIIEAFKQKQGFSLLVKGDAGTGKSTIGLEILISGENPIYISTRVSPQSLYSQFPWVEGKIPESSILDATNVLFPPSQNLVSEMQRMISFQGLPKFIEAIYHRVQDKQNVAVVIDSWDAVIKNDPEQREGDKIITSLTELIRRISVNLILITETSELTFLDYLVDGTVLLEDLDFAGRRLRLMTLKKMRGVLIRQKRYIYTLDNGRIRIFNPETNIIKGKPGTFKKFDVKDAGLVSSGNKDLDTLVKIPKGAVVNFEIKNYKGLQSLVLPSIMMVQNGIATLKELFPSDLNMLNHDSVLKPFFEKGIVSLKSGDITINLYHSGIITGESAFASPDIHLVIDSSEGILLFYGETPYTKLYGVELSVAGGEPSYKLVPVV